MEPLDADLVCQLLLKVEQNIHRRGWDQRPVLATLEIPRPNALALMEVPVDLCGAPGSIIEDLGQAFLADPKFGRMIAEDYTGHTFLGFVLISESWMLAQVPEEALARYASGVRLADTPGAQEVRTLNAVDIWGRVFMVYRVRGEKPQAYGGTSQDNPSDLADVTGRLVQGLLNMTLGAARQMPWLDGSLTDLETRFLPTIEESFESQKRTGR